MASQNDNSGIDPMLLDGDTIVVDHPLDQTSPQVEAPTSSPSTTPSSSPIVTVPRRQFAWIWKHMPDHNPQTIYKDIEGRIQWRCQHCNKVYLESGGTRIISHHLRAQHRITEHSIREEQRSRVHGSIEQAFANARQSNGYKRRRTIFNFGMDDDLTDTLKGKWISAVFGLFDSLIPAFN